MRGADLICRVLEAEGVKEIFGYPGGAIMPFYDALKDSSLTHILCRHEQGAALAADGYARASGKVGVCIATSGPGATNLVTGLANAYLDSVPVVAITGQVAQAVMGTDAFQEVDMFGITLPIVKHSVLVRDVRDLPRVLREAFAVAREGRPGPVLIDVPKDVQVAMVDNLMPFSLATSAPVTPNANAGAIEKARQMLRAARKPLAYIGGGAVLGNAIEAVREFCTITQMPAVSTLKGLGSLPIDAALHLGMLGMHGTRASNMAVQNCDVLLVIGARFDDRATGKLSEFAPYAKVIHLDIDEAEIGKLRDADVALRGDLNEMLPKLAQPLSIDAWRNECKVNAQQFAFRYDAPGDGIYAPSFLNELARHAGADTIISCDVGQHQMWVAQHYAFHHPRTHLTSGGLGTMGYGLPAAIGAQVACPTKRVINVTGDGSFLMNVQELATANRYRLPVKIVLFDNQVLGMVRQWQELFFEQRFSEVDLSDNPDFVQVAKAFGFESFALEKRSEQSQAIKRLLQSNGPMLLHVKIDSKENVWPLVPPGKSNSHMMEGAEL